MSYERFCEECDSIASCRLIDPMKRKCTAPGAVVNVEPFEQAGRAPVLATQPDMEHRMPHPPRWVQGVEPAQPAPVYGAATPTSANDAVNHPDHYNSHPSGVECIAIVEHMNFNIGNVVKYCWRAGVKPGVDLIEDLRKAEWYLSREIDRLVELRDRDRSTR